MAIPLRPWHVCTPCVKINSHLFGYDTFTPDDPFTPLWSRQTFRPLLHDTPHFFVHDTFTPLSTWRFCTPSGMIHSHLINEMFRPLWPWHVCTSLTMTCSHPWVMIYLHLFGHDMFISLMWRLVCFTSEVTCSHPFGNDPFAPFRWRHVRTRFVIIRRHMKGCFFQKLKKGVWKGASFSDLWTINLFFFPLN